MDGKKLPTVDINSVSIRTMMESDLEEVHQMWNSDLWGVFGRKTLAYMFDQDVISNKCFIAEYQGEIIGTGFAYMINEEMGELCGLFVKPAYRGFGVSKKLWDARMSYLDNRNIIVYSQNKRGESNRKLGFTHFVQRLLGYVGVPAFPENVTEESQKYVDELVPIRDTNFEQLLAYDAKIVPYVDRRKFLTAVVQKYSKRGFVAYKDGNIVGYIDEMPADGIAIVGPLYAESPQVAKALLAKFVSEMPKDFRVLVEVPETNEDGKAFLEQLGLVVMGEDTILFNKKRLEAPWDHIYGTRPFAACLW